MTDTPKDHSPEATIATAATLLRNAGQPERPEDQAEIALLSLQPGDRPREGLVVVPEDLTEDTLNPIAKAVRSRIGIEFGSNHQGTLGYYKRIFIAGWRAMIEAQETAE